MLVVLGSLRCIYAIVLYTTLQHVPVMPDQKCQSKSRLLFVAKLQSSDNKTQTENSAKIIYILVMCKKNILISVIKFLAFQNNERDLQEDKNLKA